MIRRMVSPTAGTSPCLRRIRSATTPVQPVWWNAPIEQMNPPDMATYAGLCGWTLARAHARSGDRIALAAYLGGSGRFDQAIADFAQKYADQNERDYAALQAAVKDGRAEATTDI